jgi:hypothetical protein
MAKIGPPSPTPDAVPAELPTGSAKLTISLRPFGLDASAAVPAGQARTLIATFSLLATGAAGLGSAAATLYAGPAHAWLLALAELGFALAVAVLIAASGRPAGRKKKRRGRAAITARSRRALPGPGPGPM